MLEIRKQARAERDLIEIWLYGASRWGADQADRYLDEIEAALVLLAENPGIGVDTHDARPNIRKWSVNKHLIFYSAGDFALHVIRVLGSRQHAPLHFDG